MSGRLEASIQGAVIGWARKQGIRCDKLGTGSVFQTSGLHDFIVWLPLRPLLIEFKTETGRLTALQERTHHELTGLYYEGHVVRDVESGKLLIKQTYEARLKELEMWKKRGSKWK
jgi:hypothetical protein